MLADLSNPYCDTSLIYLANLRLCIELTPSQELDRCFNPYGNEHFYLNTSANETWLAVKGINHSLNGTVISIFCTQYKNCFDDYIETNIFNFEFITNGNGIQQGFCILLWNILFSVCNNSYCSSNAACEEGICVCKPGYSGDGVMCDPGKFSFCGCVINA